MSVDLADYVDALKREVNPAGADLYPNAMNPEWVGRLSDGFWNARIEGVTALAAFSESSGVITPKQAGDPELSRDLVQLVVLWTAFNVVRNALLNLKTMFAVKAGSVSYETQQSAMLLRDVMADIKGQKGILLSRLSDVGQVSTYVIDGIIARDESILDGATYWVGASVDPRARGSLSGRGFGP